MMILLAVALIFQDPAAHGPGFGGVNFNWDRMVETAVRLEHAKRFAPVPLGPCVPAVGATRDDLRFMAAVEEFADAVDPSDAPPEPYGGMLASLGRPEWRERDDATGRLEAALLANPGDARWLFWGRRHPDPEVRLRSNAILRRLNPCPTCKGAGNSKNWSEWPCWDCNGMATTWPYSMWD